MTPRLNAATEPPKQAEASSQPFSQTVSQSARSIHKLCRCSVDLCLLLLLLFSNLACVFCRSHNGRRLTSDIWRACCNGQNAKTTEMPAGYFKEASSRPCQARRHWGEQLMHLSVSGWRVLSAGPVGDSWPEILPASRVNAHCQCRAFEADQGCEK